jgi:Fe-Mn family superoxide dismutase
MNFDLPELPYAFDALQPHIGAQTLQLHYGKHHRGYMTKLEKALRGTDKAEQTLEEIVCSSAGDVFNNAAQVWNHSFYWRCMRAGGGEPDAELEAMLRRDLGGVEAFKREFAAVAAGEFGSGWAWLVQTKGGGLKVLSSSDADNPLRNGQTPLLTLDVWEHAYYLDYQNERGKYIEAYLDHLLDWSFVRANLAAATEDDASL